MTKFYIVNAFSLSMLERADYNVALRPINPAGVRNLMRNHQPESFVGHEDTAAILSSALGVPVAYTRASLHLSGDWSMIVAQYKGPRLALGATELPEGATIEFWQVYPNYD